MAETTIQQTLPDLLEQLPTNQDEWPEEIRRDLDVFVRATNEENGLIPSGACHVIFDVSRQRWHQMSKDYLFKTWTLFGKKWYSRRQLEEFHKFDRSQYGGKGQGVKMAKMVREALRDGVSN